jgi:hypothetical protein
LLSIQLIKREISLFIEMQSTTLFILDEGEHMLVQAGNNRSTASMTMGSGTMALAGQT